MKIKISSIKVEDLEWTDDNDQVVTTTNTLKLFNFLREYTMNYGIKHKDNFNESQFEKDMLEELEFKELFKEFSTGDLSMFEDKTNLELASYIDWVFKEGQKVNQLGF